MTILCGGAGVTNREVTRNAAATIAIAGPAVSRISRQWANIRADFFSMPHHTSVYGIPRVSPEVSTVSFYLATISDGNLFDRPCPVASCHNSSTMLDHGKAPHVGHGAHDAERFTPVSQVRDFISNLLQEVLFMNASHIVSAIALLFSGYSLWETSLKRSELKVFVAPVIRYASPYQNTNFEIFAIPVTI